MVGVAGQPCTDQAGLFGDKSKVDLVAEATRLRNGGEALVDSERYSFLACRNLHSLRSVPVLRPDGWTGFRRRGGRVHYGCISVCEVYQFGPKRFLNNSRIVDSQGVFDRQASVGPIGELLS